MKRLAAVLYLTFSGLVCGQTVDVKGVALGSGLPEAATLLRGLTCSTAIPGQLRKYGDKRCTAGVTYGGAYAELNIWSFNDVVGQIIIDGKNVYWDAVRAGLLEKYGKPTQTGTPTITTVGGAVLKSELLVWQLPGARIEADMHGDAVTYVITVSGDAWAAESKRRTGKPGGDM